MTISSMRISNELERKREEKKNAIYSGHLRLCLQLKGSARTPLGPKLEEEKTNNADNRELVLHWG